MHTLSLLFQSPSCSVIQSCYNLDCYSYHSYSILSHNSLKIKHWQYLVLVFAASFTRAPTMYLYVNEIPDGQVKSVMDALNVLGSCPWRVNAPVLQHLEKVYVEGGDSKLGVPESEEKLRQRSVYVDVSAGKHGAVVVNVRLY